MKTILMARKDDETYQAYMVICDAELEDLMEGIRRGSAMILDRFGLKPKVFEEQEVQ